MFRLCASCNQAQSKQMKLAQLTPWAGPSAARLGPRAFSTGVVDSLGWGFVLNFTYVCSVEVGYDEYCC